MTTRATLLTPRTPGAVAIIQLHGDQAASVLSKLTGKTHWPPGRLRLCGFAGIDEGLAAVMPARPDVVQLMPHGGPRVVQRLLTHLIESLGVRYDPAPDPRTVYPEAASAIEADLLDAIARAASPAAIDLLTAQPRLWRQLLADRNASAASRHAIAQHSAVLDRLVTPPTVVVVGPANAGKSTLTNRLMGRSVSIVADLPGTTRDWVGGLVELSIDNHSGVAVQWLDTPGLRDSDDAVEQRAIALARRVIGDAAVIVALRDPEQGWPEVSRLPRSPDLWVMNKVDDAGDAPADDAGLSPDRPLPISAERGGGVGVLERRVLERLGLADLDEQPWAFSPRLRAWCETWASLDGYLP